VYFSDVAAVSVPGASVSAPGAAVSAPGAAVSAPGAAVSAPACFVSCLSLTPLTTSSLFVFNCLYMSLNVSIQLLRRKRDPRLVLMLYQPTQRRL